MQDLYLGMAIMGAVTIALGLVTFLAFRRMPRWVVDLQAALVIVAIIAFMYALRDGVWLARWLPYSNLVVVGNWLPVLAGVLAGLVVARLRTRPSAQWAWGIALGLVSLLAIVDPLRGQPPICSNAWEFVCVGCLVEGTEHEQIEVCRQTSQVTCSPAAACTLLETYGIPSTEDEMAADCLTRDGTTWQGLYRGLVLATRDTPYRVEVFETDFETLLAWPGPKLLFVRLRADGDHDPRYVEEWGWIPGTRHAVVLYERLPNGRLLIGDPAIGAEAWSTKDIDTLWHGRGMRLVPR